MAGLNDKQRAELRDYLARQGLTFRPLLDEMTDHIACDIEERINAGMTYDEALKQAVSELPRDHFKSIQQETMETINRRFNLSKLFTYVGLASLLLGTIFKTLHLQGASGLVLISFFALAGALIASSVSGIYLNRQKKGAINILGVVGGTILFIAGYGFKIFHLPGADELIVAATVVSLAFMAVNTIYVYKNVLGDNNLFSYLHAKHTPGIERFLLILLVPLTLYQLAGWIVGMKDFFVPLMLVVVIYSAGLQLIALAWRNIGSNPVHKNEFTLAITIAAFVCMTLPMMAELVPYEYRLVLVICFFFIAALLAIRLEAPRGMPAIVIYAVPFVILLPAMSRAGWIQIGLAVPFQVAVTLIIGTGIFLSPKESIVRTYLIMSLTVYLLEASSNRL
ncbi:MAG TPA: hypothetical protein VK508_19810 [Cyclobacteriaceae bacterium]|nr:hypothetical protein [Cyclobacteriaceae bacterium]